MKFLLFIILVVIVFFLSGCVLVVLGIDQKVIFNSEFEVVIVIVVGWVLGKILLIVLVDWVFNQFFIFEKEGYKIYIV